MAKENRNISFDSDILNAAEEYAERVTKESLSAIVQRGLRELLEKAGKWPPKRSK